MAKARSPNYPAVGLKTAIELVGRLYAAESRAPVPLALAAQAMGFKGLSGPSRTKVSSLRKYGLVDENAGKVRVSDLAMQIMFPRSDDQRVEAIREAAGRPDLFKELHPLASGSDANLTNHLMQMGFTPQGASQAVASFRETEALAGETPHVYDDAEHDDISTVTEPIVGAPAQGHVQSQVRGFGGMLKPSTTAAAFSWLLPKGVHVELRFAGGPFTKEGVQMLRRYLDVMEDAIADDDEARPKMTSEPEPPSERSRTDAQG